MAEIKQVTPPEARALLEEDSDAIYLDVRTEEEFSAGHPEGALNVPVFFFGPAGPTPNSDFLPVVEKILPKGAAILCGCKSGGRSQKASRILADAGYENVSNVRGGFGGARDATGKTVVAGWEESGLPVSTVVPDEASYAGLKRKAGG